MEMIVPLTLSLDPSALLRPLVPLATAEVRPWVVAAGVVLLVLVFLVLRQIPPACLIQLHV